MPLLMRKYELEKKGNKIRAWVNPPQFRAMPELKRLFCGEVFPYWKCRKMKKHTYKEIAMKHTKRDT